MDDVSEEVLQLACYLHCLLADNFQQFDALRSHCYRYCIVSAMRLDLMWWNQFLPTWNGVKVLRMHRQHYHIWTDASGLRGIGGYILKNIHDPPQKVFSHRFATRLREKHINVKEMFTVLFAVRKWLDTLKGTYLHLYSDNSLLLQVFKSAPLLDLL